MIELSNNERVIYEVRKHPFFFYMGLTSVALGALLPLILYQVVEVFVEWAEPGTAFLFFSFIYVLWLSLLWVSAFISWTTYFLDTWIITNERIVDFEMKGLFSHDVASVRTDNIQDVKINVDGILNTYLNVGEIHIQTAGRDKEFVIKYAINPDKAKDVILSASQMTGPAIDSAK